MGLNCLRQRHLEREKTHAENGKDTYSEKSMWSVIGEVVFYDLKYKKKLSIIY